MSDTDPLYRELEGRQRLLLGATPFRVNLFHDTKEIRSALKELYSDNSFEFSGGLARAAHMKNDLDIEFSRPFPTRYEAPELYVLLTWENILIKNVLAGADRNSDLKLAQAPVLGTLPSTSLGASTFGTTGSSNKVIAINWGMFDIVTAMTELALQTVKIEVDRDGKSVTIDDTEQEFRRRIRSRPDLKAELIHTLVYFYGHEKSDPRSPSPPRALIMFGSISRAIQLFVLAHEYGHLLAKHEDVTAKHSAGPDSDSLVHSWAQESEADVIGFELLHDVLKQAASEVHRQNEFLGYHLLAPLLYFEFVRIVDESGYILQHRRPPPRPDPREIWEAEETLGLALQDLTSGRWQDGAGVTAFSRYSDHPPAWLRWELAKGYFARDLPGLKKKGQANFAGLAVALGSNMHELWDESVSDFVELVKEMGNEGK